MMRIRKANAVLGTCFLVGSGLFIYVFLEENKGGLYGNPEAQKVNNPYIAVHVGRGLNKQLKPGRRNVYFFRVRDMVADPDQVGSGMFSSDPDPVLSFRIRIRPIKKNYF